MVTHQLTWIRDPLEQSLLSERPFLQVNAGLHRIGQMVLIQRNALSINAD